MNTEPERPPLPSPRSKYAPRRPPPGDSSLCQKGSPERFCAFFFAVGALLSGLWLLSSVVGLGY